MEATNRIIVNTAVQYARSAVYMALMLFTTRYILAALGHADYGIYAAIGSTVFMMGFITLSLASSTQRFLSVEHGKGCPAALRAIFANAFALHALIALAIALFMAACEPLFISYLRIPASRLAASVFVYFMVLLMVLLGFITAPVRALFIARENIVYVSVVEVADAVLKLLGALLLPYVTYDRLCLYGLLMLLVQVFNFLCYTLYAGLKYDECHLPRRGELRRDTMRRLTGFAVWNVYNVGSTVARTQGIALIISHFLGTLVNAAYGIALQVSNAVSFIALSILNSINPQLMKAEGAGDRTRMLRLAQKESKYSFLVLSLLLVPLIVEMPAVLRFWLGAAPEHTTMFCRLILVDYILDQLTIGLSSANQAIGRIRDYSLLTSTIRLLTLPAAAVLLALGHSPLTMMCCFVGINIVIGIIRVPYLTLTAGLRWADYLRDVLLRALIPLLSVTAAACLIASLADIPFRFVITEAASVCIGLPLIYALALTPAERQWIINRLRHAS